MSDSDSALVQRVLAGETGPFRELVRRYQDAVYGVALSRTGNAADAEDVAQEAFLSAFGSLEQLRDPARFGSWLYRIAVNCAKVRMRSESRRRARHEAVPGRRTEHPPADEAAGRNETRARVMDALGRLSQVNREAATLYYIDGYSTADIGRFTGRPVGTVKRRLHDARVQLRKELVAMVETELKKGRPGKAFTEKVAATIERVRVWNGGPEGQTTLMLTDSKGRSYRLPMGGYEADTVLRSISGGEPPEAADDHSALIELLARFACRIAEVGVSRFRVRNVRLKLSVRGPGRSQRTVEADYGLRDAAQFVVQTGAPVTIDDKLAEHWAARRKDGTPMSPLGAWRSVPKRKRPVFTDLAAVLRALERNPDSERARTAVREADGTTMETPWVRDVTGGMEVLLAWHGRRKGTKHEALAAGIVGACYLDKRGTPAKALPYLESAHRLEPADEAVAFDLATAYMLVERPDDALAILEELRPEEAARCGNFADLWDDPRFRAAVPPEPRMKDMKDVFLVKGTPARIFYASPPDASGAEKRPRTPSAAPAAVGPRRLRELERRLDRGTLTPIVRVYLTVGAEGRTQSLVMECEDGHAVAAPSPPWPDQRDQELATIIPPQKTPWRRRSQFALDVLKGLGIRPKASVLFKVDGETMVAGLSAESDGRWEEVTMDGTSAVSLALNGRFPLLVTQELAEQLYVRGKTGRPVRPRTALRRLRADDGE